MDFMEHLIWIINVLMFGLMILAAYRSTRAHTKKNILHHSPTASGASLIEEDYELTFQLEDGKKRSFLVWPMVFDSVCCGEEGILKYKGDDLISFGKHIKEFDLN